MYRSNSTPGPVSNEKRAFDRANQDHANEQLSPTFHAFETQRPRGQAGRVIRDPAIMVDNHAAPLSLQPLLRLPGSVLRNV